MTRDTKPASDAPPVRDGNTAPRVAPPVFATAIVALGLLWCSFPPLGLAWLAWIAPGPLIVLVLSDRLTGKRPYAQLYIAGLLYWLTTFYFIPYPHPLLYGGWLAVSAYMAVYTPLTVGISRTLHHRWRVPAIIAVPLVWTGIEWIRCHFATGMAMVCLSHSQAQWTTIIQIADLAGAYAVTWLIITVATGLTLVVCAIWWRRPRTGGNATSHRPMQPRGILLAVGWSALGFAAAVLYGQQQLQPSTTDQARRFHAAIVQTSEDVVFQPPTDSQLRGRLARLANLHRQAVSATPRPDVVLWPESALVPFVDLFSDISPQYTVEMAQWEIAQFWRDASTTASGETIAIPLIAGGSSADPAQDDRYNSAVLIRDGRIVDRYHKRHLVMFGEYVPLADQIEWIQHLSPMRNLNSGSAFESFTVDDIRLAPNVCFETTVPHLIRRQINELIDAGERPDVMVNLTNDGWFFGTSCLDFHLACNIFRSVEMRMPMLVCANTGLSAQIDSRGRLVQRGPRRQPAVLNCEVTIAPEPSVYRRFGDWLPMLFAIVVLAAAVAGFWPSRRPG